MIEVIDNFLSKKDFKSLYSLATGYNIPWLFGYILNEEYKYHNKNNYHHTHVFWHVYAPSYMNPPMITSPIFFEKILPILKKLNVNENQLMRIKLNSEPKKIFRSLTGYHTDDFPCNTSAIYYINSNNGGTKFEKSGKVVRSVENRMVIFDSNLIHSGIYCTNKSRRLVLNLNYER